MWATALKSGKGIYDGHTYLTQVWLECREMAVEFLQEAVERLPGRCDDAFEQAIGHYSVVRDKLCALAGLSPERPEGWIGRRGSPAQKARPWCERQQRPSARA
jgi:hypothetical protein